MHTFTAIIFTLQAIVKRVVAYKVQRMEIEKIQPRFTIVKVGFSFKKVKK
jgi:hypothetical protein